MSIEFGDESVISELIFLTSYQLCKNTSANKSPPNFKNEFGGFYCIGISPAKHFVFLFGRL